MSWLIPSRKSYLPDHWDEEVDRIWKPSKVPNPHIKDHGSARKLRIPIIQGNGRLLGLIIHDDIILGVDTRIIEGPIITEKNCLGVCLLSTRLVHNYNCTHPHEESPFQVKFHLLQTKK
ncbi:uncharacterized protein LOC121244108 [Juglans microcarpa x Juglans regia]|uniref:uncharacterized protein LOC121244108 n=1 Tax=Juglans microcarpa x Juglans regia TaxID=2249226 RepID=UPI001B7EDE0E|nr:uncharacterized protein LOC121244108 [Juglans microcarpa x Juglans regia]